MGDERFLILKLLEQGKITESEAEQLLDALGDIEYDQATQEASSTFNKSSENTYTKDNNDDAFKKTYSNTNKDREFEETLESIGKRFEKLGQQLGDKFDDFGEEFGEKMVNLGTVFANKSIDFAEKIVDTVEKTIDSDTFINVDLFGTTKSYKEILEKKLIDIDDISLQLETYNGSILISKWEQPMIRVTAFISAKESKYDANKPILETQEYNGVISFRAKKVDGVGVKLNVQLPDKVYNFIKAQGTNGSITVENLSCNKLFLQTKNASIRLNNVETQGDTSCTTTNNKIIIENSKAENLLAATKNGKILIADSSIKRIEGITSNSKITIKDIKYSKLQSLSLKTSNAKVEVLGSIPKNIGVHFEASTTHGNINIGIPVSYTENIKNYSSNRIVAKTSEFDICESIAYIKAYTTNSTIFLFN